MFNVDRSTVPLKWIEYGLYGDLVKTYPKSYSIYLRGTIDSLTPKTRESGL